MKRSTLFFAAVLIGLSTPSCQFYNAVTKATTYKTSVATTDQIIGRAEDTAKVAGLTFDELLAIDDRFRDETKKYLPKVHEFCEYLREPSKNPDGSAMLNKNGKPIRRGNGLIISLRTATKTFKANRTTKEEANLRTVLATVQELYTQAKAHLAQAQTLKAP